MNWETVVEQGFFGNPWSKWMLAASIFVAILGAVRILLLVVRRYAGRAAARTSTILDDLVVSTVQKTKLLLVVLIAAWSAGFVLSMPDWVASLLGQAAVVAFVLQAGLWASTMLHDWIVAVKRRKAGEEEAVTWLGGVEWVGKLSIWTVAVLVGLENLGVDVTGLVTGLGITGIAVALAVQNILGDIFASLSIYLDKPFVLGDFLAVDSYLGTVESIGLKTTRLRSLSGEQLVISNSDLLGSRIRNYGRMVERRAAFTIGVTYDTPAAKVARIPALIREAIEAQTNTRFDRSHFKEFGDFSLNVETVYYMKVPAYAEYMDVQQAVNLALLDRFAQEGIEFAFPTQTVILDPPDKTAC